MRSYRRLRTGLAAAVAGYVVLGLAAAGLPPKHEVFPFFCWFLFPVSPALEERWALRVDEVGGVPLPTPRWYEELGVTRDPWAMDAFVTIQALGRAVRDQDVEAEARHRRRLEANFLPTPARYALVRVRFEVLERWREGTLREAEVVARYGATEPESPGHAGGDGAERQGPLAAASGAR